MVAHQPLAELFRCPMLLFSFAAEQRRM